MWQVRLENQGFTWFLRGTTWTAQRERADHFELRAMAFNAAKAAEEFMKPFLRGRQIVEPTNK